MKVSSEIKLDFNDVLLRPKRSTLCSRSDVTLERTMTFAHSKKTWTGIPIIVSNMDTVGTVEMWKTMSKYKMLVALHKYVNIEEVLNAFKDGADPNYVMISTGISENDHNKLKNNFQLLEKHNCEVPFICVDIANGYMQMFVEFCKKIRAEYPNKIIIAGNVVSREVCEELVISGGVDVVKVGIGSGSVCTTRLQTGVGMP